MKTLLFLLLSAAVFNLTFFNKDLQAQWIQVNSPNGGEIRAIACSKNKIAVFDDNYGMYLSMNSGKSWQKINDPLPWERVNSLLIKGDTILAGFIGYGLYISTDNGNNWEQSTSGIPGNSIINALAEYGSSILAAAKNGLFKSMNNGSSWQNMSDGILSADSYNSIVVNENKIVLGTGAGVYLSTDGGATWKHGNTGLPDLNVTKVALKGNYIFAAVNKSFPEGYGVYRSTDNISTWEVANNGMPPQPFIYCLTSDGFNLFAGFYWKGIYRTTDSGSHWEQAYNGLPVPIIIYDIAVSDTGIFAATDGAGVLLSTDGGSSWNESNNGLNGLNVYSSGVKGDSLFLGTNFAGIFLSTDKGVNWKRLLYFDNFNNGIISFAFDPTNIYAGTSEAGILRSTDNGLTWDYLNAFPGHSVTVMAHKDRLFASVGAKPGDPGGRYYSTDGGDSWHEMNFGYSMTSNGNELFVISADTIYISADAGSSWKKTGKRPEGKRFLGIRAAINSIFAVMSEGLSDTSPIKVYVSTDKGNSWNPADNGLPDMTTGVNHMIGSMVFTGQNIIFAEFYSDGVYMSMDNGLNWKAVNSGLALKNYNDLAICGNYIFAVGNNKVFRSKISELISTASISPFGTKELLPEEYRLEQNYPNPFNPTTRISYSIPVSQNVKLTVYNMLGKEVSTLVNEYKAAGSYIVQFNASSLPSGIYIYRIQAGQYRNSKKLILLK